MPERHLNIVAHHDDDLLFLAPDLYDLLKQAWTSPDVCVRTVYLVGQGSNRAQGVREVYAAAYFGDTSKKDAQWVNQLYTGSAHQATLWTLVDHELQVSILELCIRDNYDLWKLYTGELQQIASAEGDKNDVQVYDRDSLITFLRDIVTVFRPTVVRVTDPTADHYVGYDVNKSGTDDYHLDHIATCRMAKYAINQLPLPPKLLYYMDYQLRYPEIDTTTLDDLNVPYSQDDPKDITKEQHATKVTYWNIYDALDPNNRGYYFYKLWRKRMYQVVSRRLDTIILPLPPTPAPFPPLYPISLGLTYRIVNVGTGQILSLWGGSILSLPSLPPLPVPFGTIYQYVSQHICLQAQQRGWQFVCSRPNIVLASDDSPQAGAHLMYQEIDSDPNTNKNQVVHIYKYDQRGYTLKFANNDTLAITGSNNPLGHGSPITLENNSNTSNVNQLWTFKLVDPQDIVPTRFELIDNPSPLTPWFSLSSMLGDLQDNTQKFLDLAQKVGYKE